MATGNFQSFFGGRPGMRPAAPTQGQPFQPAMRGGATPQQQMQRAAPMAAPGPGPTGGMAGRAAGMFGGAGSTRGAMGGLMSDERSKEKINELEGIKQRYLALIDPDEGRGSLGDEISEARRAGAFTSGEADAFGDVGSHEFSYKPEFQDKPGAGRGRFAGPMTSELKGIPGVVKKGHGGMEQVDTPRLTMANASATGELARDMEDLRARFAALSDNPDATLDVAGGRKGVDRQLERLEALPRGPMSARDRASVERARRMGF